MRKSVIVLFSMLFASSGFATVWPVQNTAIWSNPAHWNTGTLPTTSDAVIINTGRNLVADTNATIVSLNVPNADNHSATLTLTNDITLKVTSWAHIGYAAYDNATSTMNHSAGTFNAATLIVASGTDSTATYNLSGSGNLTGTTLDIGQTSDGRSVGTTVFNQSGGTVSSATVKIAGRADVHYVMTDGQMDVTDLTIGDGTTPAESFLEIGPNAPGISIADDFIVGPRGQLVFNVGENGECTTIEVTNLFDVISGSAKIFVDAALYTGGATNIELITYNSLGTEFQRQAIMNLPSGLTGSLVYNANSLVLEIVSDTHEASISNVTAVSDNLISMTVTASDPEVSTIKTATNLVSGTWLNAAYSTNSIGPFTTGTLSSSELTVYVQATNPASFFKVGNN